MSIIRAEDSKYINLPQAVNNSTSSGASSIIRAEDKGYLTNIPVNKFPTAPSIPLLSTTSTNILPQNTVASTLPNAPQDNGMYANTNKLSSEVFNNPLNKQAPVPKNSPSLLQEFGGGISSALHSVKDDLHNIFTTSKDTPSQVGLAFKTIKDVLNVPLSIVSVPFQAAGKLPVVGTVTKAGMDVPLSAIADTVSPAATYAVDKLPISTDAKDKIREPFKDLMVLAAQIYAGGKVIDPLIKAVTPEFTSKYGKETADHIINTAKEIAQKQNNNGIINSNENTKQSTTNITPQEVNTITQRTGYTPESIPKQEVTSDFLNVIKNRGLLNDTEYANKIIDNNSTGKNYFSGSDEVGKFLDATQERFNNGQITPEEIPSILKIASDYHNQALDNFAKDFQEVHNYKYSDLTPVDITQHLSQMIEGIKDGEKYGKTPQDVIDNMNELLNKSKNDLSQKQTLRNVKKDELKIRKDVMNNNGKIDTGLYKRETYNNQQDFESLKASPKYDKYGRELYPQKMKRIRNLMKNIETLGSSLNGDARSAIDYIEKTIDLGKSLKDNKDIINHRNELIKANKIVKDYIKEFKNRKNESSLIQLEKNITKRIENTSQRQQSSLPKAVETTSNIRDSILPKENKVLTDNNVKGIVSKPQEISGGKTSGVAKSIEQKAIDNNAPQFDKLAGYEGSTLKEQENIFNNTATKGVEHLKKILKGEAPLPEGAKSAPFVVNMEKFIKDHPELNKNGELSYELANSVHTSAFSEAASQLGLSQNREQDSFTKKINEIKKAKEIKAKSSPEKITKIKSKARESMNKINLSKDDLGKIEDFITKNLC